jgi:hypothetical protein
MAITFCQAERQLARERCAKATNSKAVGGTQPTALPSSPIRAAIVDEVEPIKSKVGQRGPRFAGFRTRY